MKTLLDVELQEEVLIHHIEQEPFMKRRLMDLGFVDRVKVMPVLNSPSKRMRAYLMKGCKIALRDEESRGIYVIEQGEENAV